MVVTKVVVTIAVTDVIVTNVAFVTNVVIVVANVVVVDTDVVAVSCHELCCFLVGVTNVVVMVVKNCCYYKCKCCRCYECGCCHNFGFKTKQLKQYVIKFYIVVCLSHVTHSKIWQWPIFD